MIELRPYITEKTVTLAKSGKFTLIADKNMNKSSAILAIKHYFKLTSVSCNIVNQKSAVSKTAKGKKRTSRGFKKIVITLKKGESLPGFATFTKETKEEKKEKKTKEAK